MTLRIGSEPVRIPLQLGSGHILLDADTRELSIVLDRLRRAGRDGFFVDIGANIGQSLVALMSTGIRSRYLGFEPDVEACAYAARLLRENRFEKGHVMAMALGDVSGAAHMHTKRECWVGASLTTAMTPETMYGGVSWVPVAPGDAQLAPLADEEILLIKIDVEGYELPVLRGLQETLKRSDAALFVEVLAADHFLDGSYSREYFGELTESESEGLVEARIATGRAVEVLLRDSGRRIFEVDPNGALVELAEIDLIAPRPGLQGERNFLAVHRGSSIFGSATP